MAAVVVKFQGELCTELDLGDGDSGFGGYIQVGQDVTLGQGSKKELFGVPAGGVTVERLGRGSTDFAWTISLDVHIAGETALRVSGVLPLGSKAEFVSHIGSFTSSTG